MAAVALGVPLVIAGTVPPCSPGGAAATTRRPDLAGVFSAQVVDRSTVRRSSWPSGPTPPRSGVRGAPGSVGRAGPGQARLGCHGALLISVCSGLAVTAVLAVGVDAVHAHRLGQVMVAVLPLAALATFETVPGVPSQSAGRSPCGRGRRASSPSSRPVPVRDPADQNGSVRRARVRFGEPPSGTGRASHAPSTGSPSRGVGGRVAVTGSSGAGKSSLVNALCVLAARGGDACPRRDRSRRSCPGRRPRPPARSPTSGPSSSPARCAPTSPSAGPGHRRGDRRRALAAARLADWVAPCPRASIPRSARTACRLGR